MSELTHEVRNLLGRANPGPQEIGDAKQALERIADALETLASSEDGDHDQLAGCRVILARAALELSQKTVPRLNELATEILRVAGRPAIVVACAPVMPIGSDRDGNPLPPRPSEYVLPDAYKTTTSKVEDAVKSAGTRLASAVASLVG